MPAPRLAEHDPAWAWIFEAERERIADALGDAVIHIEHIGSTAVPGLAAKPTVDIAVGATTIDLPPSALARMADLGYEDAGPASRPGERRFRKGRGFPREVLVHVVEWGGSMWRDYLRFRDALRSDSGLARDYAELKRTLLSESGSWYQGEDKQGFIDDVLLAAPSQAFLLSASPEETKRVAAALAVRLRPGDVVTVAGELGAGKTTFVRGAAHALGVTDAVTSPTYTIGHRYAGTVPVSHLDLYRFERLGDADWGALEPYFEDAITFVEWPEAAAGWLAEPRAGVRLEHVDSGRRRIALESAEQDLLAGLI